MNLSYVQNEVSQHMDAILEMFKKPAHITVIVRRPNLPEQDFMLTNDQPDEIVALVNRRKAAGEGN